MTTLHIHSTGLIYSPGLFRWIVEGFKRDKPKAEELLLALGVPAEYVAPILAGKYQQHTEGETLVLTLAEEDTAKAEAQARWLERERNDTLDLY